MSAISIGIPYLYMLSSTETVKAISTKYNFFTPLFHNNKQYQNFAKKIIETQFIFLNER